MRTAVQSPTLIRLGQYVRGRRRELGLTQTDLADRLGYVQERISLLENGKYGLPSVTSLKALADALQVTLAAVLQEAGIPVGAAPTVHPSHTAPSERQHLAEQCHRLLREIEGTNQRMVALEQRMQAADTLRETITSKRQALEEIAATLSREAGSRPPA